MTIEFVYKDSDGKKMIKESNKPKSYSFTYFSNSTKNCIVSSHETYELALYNIDDLKSAIEENQEVFFVGNEYEVELLKEFGYVATTLSHFHCYRKQIEEILKVFKGATVYITNDWLSEIELGDFINISGSSYLLKTLFYNTKSINYIPIKGSWKTPFLAKNILDLYCRVDCVDKDFIRAFNEEMYSSFQITEKNFDKNEMFIIN